MISGLASYLFGYSGEGVPPPTGRLVNGNVEMSTSVADNDWLLVDVMDESKETNSVRSDGCSTNCTPSPQPSDDGMIRGESWFLTPAPCFNASSTSLRSVTTSPLENLLIEHPSMSVYGPQLSMVRSNHVTDLPLTRTVANGNKKSKRRNKKNKENVDGHVVASRRTPAMAAVHFGLSTDVVSMSVKSGQLAVKQRDYHNMSPRKLDRTNRLAQTGGKRQKRQNFANTYKLCSNRC